MIAAGAFLLAAALSNAYARAGTSSTVGLVDADVPAPELMFGLAKGAWRARLEAPFVTFNLRERYTWRGRIHDNWWTAYYRAADRNLVLHRMLVAQDEAQRLKGFPIAFNIRSHRNDMRADSVDTSADADAFPILDPMIDPDASFGLLATDPHAVLVGNATPRPGASAATPAAQFAPTPEPTPATVTSGAPLREVARVEAVARDYAIAFAGTDRLATGDAYHLTLTPLRNPATYRLRDLWLDPMSYATLQLTVQGLFTGKPYDGARWTVRYIAIGDRYYIRDIRSSDALRFGMDRMVSDLEYDFVGYDFPATIPDVTFRHLL
jgi:hypothetical protein